ncbi:MAG: hypothetical protein ABIZ04_22540 [Opitutus sp.]
MKLPRVPLLLAFISSLLIAPLGLAAPASANPAEGYWAGTVTLPNQELAISFELVHANSATWQGTITIAMQGLKGFKLDPVKVDGENVVLGLPGIPGEPTFNGKLAADGKSIAGELSQNGGTVPFHVQRTAKPAASTDDLTPAHGVPGKGLAGKWRGSLNPMPNVELRLGLELAPDASGSLGGVLVSVDQGNARIPVSGVTEQGSDVHFDTPKEVGGDFTGKLNADGSEISGVWTQRGRSTPLVFKRLP